MVHVHLLTLGVVSLLLVVVHPHVLLLWHWTLTIPHG